MTNNKKSKSKYSQTEKLAYTMGCISRGLKNPNSLVYESYHNGLTPKTKEKKPRKSMF